MDNDDEDVPFWYQPNPYEANEGCALIIVLVAIGIIYWIWG